ncbi:MAG: PAS domain S-box protein, partial [Akkermansiaceae bacterium]|nr:PAS domain S-box protein [Armatimonadota bacterium]
MTDVPAGKSAPELQISDVAGTVSGLFSMLADAMPQIVWATDADGSHFYYNRRWYEYTGMTEADSMGFGFSIPLHPDDYARTIQRWRQAWEAGEDYDIEYRFRRHDGVYRWFVGRATPIRDTHSGEVRMWIGTCTDIDDARRAFDGLGESQGRLALALQTARLGTWEYDYATRGFEFSPRTMELFGVTNSAVSFDEWAALLHEDDQNTVVTAATAIIGQTPPYEADDAVIRVQYRTRRPDNTIRHLLVMGARLFGADGNAVRIVGVAQDVSEERDTLDALRESADALRESESRLRSVVSNAPIVVFAVNKDGVFTFSDGAALASLGLKPGQVVGTSVFDLYADHPDIVAYIRRALGGEIITWSAVVGGTHFETQCTPVTNDRGEIEGIIAVAFDTTEKSEAAEALAAREEQYRFLFNTVASGVVYQDGEARILDANPAAEEILGLTLRQMIGMYSFDSRWKAVREDGSDLPNEEHPVPIALRTGQIVRAVPMGVYHPVEGRYRWLSVTAVPLTRPGASKPHLVYAYLDDYTERREAEAALRESESRFRSVLRAAPIVVFALDRNGVFLLHDGAGLIAAGREPGFSVGRSVWDVYADFPGLLEPTRSALAGETTEWRTSVHGVTYDTKAIAVRDENGAMNGIIGVSFDVSEQDKAEKSLRESESRFRDLADNISQLAWMTDETGYIFWYNQRWFDYTGTTLEEMRGWGWQKVQHPDYV